MGFHRFTEARAPVAPDADELVFDHSPQRGRWSMIAYEGGQPLEYNFGAVSLKAAIRRANDMTQVSVRRRFILRDPDGVIVRDQAWDAKLGVATMRAIHGRKKRPARGGKRAIGGDPAPDLTAHRTSTWGLS